MRLTRQNSNAEIDAFDTVCSRLGGFDDRLSTEWVDGWMTALAAGPLAPQMADWLTRMAGDAYDRAFADPSDRKAAERALHARMAVLLDQLDPEALIDDPDALHLSPLMLLWDDAERAEAVARGEIDAEHAGDLATGSVWADGFIAALDAHGADWISQPDDDQAKLLADLLKQVQALRLPDGSDALRAHVEALHPEPPADPAEYRNLLVDDATYAVQDLRLWWLDQAPKTETRRVDKPPGRNEPCPCGSGRKFKKCHGA